MDVLDPFQLHWGVSKIRGSWLSICSFKHHTFTEQLSLQAAKSNLMKSMRFVVSGYLEVHQSGLFVFEDWIQGLVHTNKLSTAEPYHQISALGYL